MLRFGSRQAPPAQRIAQKQGFSKLWNWFNKAQFNKKLMIHDTGSTQQGWSVFATQRSTKLHPRSSPRKANILYGGLRGLASEQAEVFAPKILKSRFWGPASEKSIFGSACSDARLRNLILHLRAASQFSLTNVISDFQDARWKITSPP